MAIYSIIAQRGPETLGTKIQAVYPDNCALPPSAWFIADANSAEQVCAKLNLMGGESSTQGVVLRVLGGAGFAAADVWDWFKAKREKSSLPFAREITTQGPPPLGPANHEEGVMAEHENALPLTQEPGRDLSEPPPRDDPPAKQVAYARSRLRPLIFFIAGVVATLVWQSWGGAALDAIHGAARGAICPQATAVQDNHDMTSSSPSPSRWRHGLGWRAQSVR